jgi:hypothetical protein
LFVSGTIGDTIAPPARAAASATCSSASKLRARNVT